MASLICLCAGVLFVGGAQGQEPGVQFAVEPGPGAQTAPGGGYFQIQAEPGEKVRQSVSLLNESDRSITLDLAAVDAMTGQLGGASYGIGEEPVEATGAWIELDRKNVDLKPGASRMVDFLVTVPEDGSPGVHLAGIAVSEVAPDEADDDEDDPVSVVVNTRRVIAVQVDLPGPKTPELVVTGVSAAARPDGLYLEIGIENQGTDLTTGEGSVEITAQGFQRDFAVDTFIPGTSIAYPIKWTEQPLEGEFDASVEISYEGGLAEWTGSVVVGDPVLADLEDRGVEVQGQGLPLVPVVLATAVVLMALTALWFVMRRRRAPVTRRRSDRLVSPDPHRPEQSFPYGSPSRGVQQGSSTPPPRHAPPPPPPPPPPERR